MEMKLFMGIVLLIIINGFVQTFFKCIHDKFCKVCKK